VQGVGPTPAAPHRLEPATGSPGRRLLFARESRLAAKKQISGNRDEEEDADEQPNLPPGRIFAPHFLGAPAALFYEKPFPILHAQVVED